MIEEIESDEELKLEDEEVVSAENNRDKADNENNSRDETQIGSEEQGLINTIEAGTDNPEATLQAVAASDESATPTEEGEDQSQQTEQKPENVKDIGEYLKSHGQEDRAAQTAGRFEDLAAQKEELDKLIQQLKDDPGFRRMVQNMVSSMESRGFRGSTITINETNYTDPELVKLLWLMLGALLKNTASALKSEKEGSPTNSGEAGSKTSTPAAASSSPK